MIENKEYDFTKPLQIAEDVYWCGFVDEESKLHCNPYLIIDNDEAVVIDGGSRPDFSEVMLKILRTGVKPSQIYRLIYHHYDPDLCGSIPHFEEVIDNKDLSIITDSDSAVFIKYYSVSSPFQIIKKLNYQWSFSSGRTLNFIPLPYVHTAGTFVTFDDKTKTLFSSDLFGSYDSTWEFYLNIEEECRNCTMETCVLNKSYCPIKGIIKFHKIVMPCNKALKMALKKVKSLPFERIASQHGNIIPSREKAMIVINKLEALEDVGIDGIKDDKQ